MPILTIAAGAVCALSIFSAANPSPTPPGTESPTAGAEGTGLETSGLPTIPLVGWWGPPPSGVHLGAYRHGFLNVIPVALRDATPVALDRAHDNGLSVMLELPPGDSFELDAIPEAVREHRAISACMVLEGVTAETAAEALRRAEGVLAFAPEWLPVAAVWADPADPEWEAVTATLSAAGVAVVPKFLPFAQDGTTDEAALHAVLRAASAAARQGGAPVWGMVQVTEHGNRRRASESDMRLQAYSSLAHGARGLAYFTYWGPPGRRPGLDADTLSFKHPMVDTRRGAPLYGHQMARVINAEITFLMPFLETLEPLGVYFVGEMPEGVEPFRPGLGPITRVNSARALVGYFRGADGVEWAMVVNRQHGAQRSARTQGRTMGIGFEDGVTAIHAIERQSGLAVPIPINDGYFAVTAPGGTGTLLRFERDADGEE